MKSSGIQTLLITALFIFAVSCSLQTGAPTPDQSADHKQQVVITEQSSEDGNRVVEQSFYPDGTREYEAQYYNGRLDGVARHWDEEGQLLSQVDYVNGNIHGLWLQYYPDGTIQRSTAYFHGKKHGVERHYHENGRLKSEQTFRMNKAVSPIVRWDSSGNLLN